MQLIVLELVSGESTDKSNPLQMQRFGPNNSSPLLGLIITCGHWGSTHHSQASASVRTHVMSMWFGTVAKPGVFLFPA